MHSQDHAIVAEGWDIGRESAQVKRALMLHATNVGAMDISQKTARARAEKERAARIREKARAAREIGEQRAKIKDGTRVERDRERSRERGRAKVKEARADSMSSVQWTGADGARIGAGGAQGLMAAGSAG